jgi:hypothetical protein
MRFTIAWIWVDYLTLYQIDTFRKWAITSPSAMGYMKIKNLRIRFIRESSGSNKSRVDLSWYVAQPQITSVESFTKGYKKVRCLDADGMCI